MYDSHWAPTEFAREALGPLVVSAVPVRPHAGHASKSEILSLFGLFVVVVIVARTFPWFIPIGPSLASAAVAIAFLVGFYIRRSWAWHLLKGQRTVLGTVAVFYERHVELHDEQSIRTKRPIETHSIDTVRYSGFTDWANPRLRLGDRSWATERAYRPYIAAALAPS